MKGRVLAGARAKQGGTQVLVSSSEHTAPAGDQQRQRQQQPGRQGTARTTPSPRGKTGAVRLMLGTEPGGTATPTRR